MEMSEDQARAALAALTAARNRSDIDESTKERLAREQGWIVERLQALTK
jgi:hypothetical protein